MGDRLSGKVALVSGAASGMGASHARGIVAEGGRVVIADLDDARGAALADELGAHALFHHLDVTDRESWRAAVAFAEERFGHLDVLVNNAGIINQGALEEYSDREWDLVMAVNAKGVFLGLAEAVDALRRARPASVINVSSAAGIHGIAGMHGYTASKFAVRGLTKSAALELAGQGVRVNSIHPGFVDTPMTAPMIAASRAAGLGAGSESLLTRPARPEEITALVVYLASNESSFSTGAEFLVDGGVTAGVA